jgi:hypothetical protein
MKTQLVPVRQNLLVLCFLVCVVVALAGPSVAAVQGHASVDAPANDAWQADSGAGVSGPPPTKSERLFSSSNLPWLLLPLALAGAALFVRAWTPQSWRGAIGKLAESCVPACITFGPLFMTRIAGTASTQVGDELVFAGVLMLAFGLCVMLSTIQKQQKLIAELRTERQRDVDGDVAARASNA